MAKIGIACDHAGKELKKLVLDYLKLAEMEVEDYGVGFDTTQSVDYPDYAELVASDLSHRKIDYGILICGTGIGMSIVANKFAGVRATAVWDEYSAKMSRAHNDANLLCLGSRTINYHRAIDLTKLWLDTPFEGDRHKLRLNKLAEIEKKNLKPENKG